MSKIYAVIGPSGSGKTALSKAFTNNGIPKLVTTTTREMRPDEIYGVDYYFVSEEEFIFTELIEHAKYAGNHYGLSLQEVKNKLKNNDKAFAIVEKNGVDALQDYFGVENVIVIYVYCSMVTLCERIIARGSSKEEITKRIRNIQENGELQYNDIADYIIINDKRDLEHNIKLLEFIIDNT